MPTWIWEYCGNIQQTYPSLDAAKDRLHWLFDVNKDTFQWEEINEGGQYKTALLMKLTSRWQDSGYRMYRANVAVAAARLAA